MALAKANLNAEDQMTTQGSNCTMVVWTSFGFSQYEEDTVKGDVLNAELR